jgi:hypothetical protein
MFGIMEKDKYIVIFAKKINGKYSKVGKKKAAAPQVAVPFKNKTYLINYDNILYRDGLKNYILLDVDNMEQIGDKVISQIPPELIDTVLTKSVVHQLLVRLQPSGMGMISIVLMLMTILAGIFIGYFIGNVIPYEQIANATRNIKLPW